MSSISASIQPSTTTSDAVTKASTPTTSDATAVTGVDDCHLNATPSTNCPSSSTAAIPTTTAPVTASPSDPTMETFSLPILTGGTTKAQSGSETTAVKGTDSTGFDDCASGSATAGTKCPGTTISPDEKSLLLIILLFLLFTTRTPKSPQAMPSQLIKLTSEDEVAFEVARDVIKQSIMINTMITNLGMDDEDATMDVPIPLPKVAAAHLKMVIEWCEHHKDDAPVEEEEEKDDDTVFEEKKKMVIPEWDQDFLRKLSQADLFHLAIAANYMEIKALLKYIVGTIADQIRGKNNLEICKYFGVKHDFKPEQLEMIKKDNAVEIPLDS